MMEVETIDLEFLSLPEGIASFLVRGPEGVFLVESGPESTRETLVAKLAERGIAVSDLEGVLVTHVHLDHAGAAGWFAREGVPVYVHPKGLRHLVDPTRLVESARSVYGDRFEGLWGDMVPAPPEAAKEWKDGETLRIAGLEVTAWSTPGHAFHHQVYQVGDSVFTGDAAGARLPGQTYLSVTSAPSQFHLEHTLASLQRIEALRPQRLFLTHFGEVADPGSHLDQYAAAVKGSAFLVHDLLRDGFDPASLEVAYEAFQLEQAYRAGLPPADWQRFQSINPAAMCADGIRLFWEARFREEGGGET